jgi:hypothetical protein
MVFFDSKLINLAHPRIVALNPLTLLRYLMLLWFSAIQVNADQPLNFVIFVNHNHAVSAWGIKSDRFQEINPTRNIDSLGSTGYSFINAFCSNGSSAPGSATMLTRKICPSAWSFS